MVSDRSPSVLFLVHAFDHFNLLGDLARQVLLVKRTTSLAFLACIFLPHLVWIVRGRETLQFPAGLSSFEASVPDGIEVNLRHLQLLGLFKTTILEIFGGQFSNFKNQGLPFFLGRRNRSPSINLDSNF